MLCFIEVNDVVVCQYGYSCDEFLLMSIFDICLCEGWDEVCGVIQWVQVGDLFDVIVCLYWCKDGSVFEVCVYLFKFDFDG